MIYKLQTKNKKVLINPIKQTKGQVFLTVQNIIFDGSKYTASIQYSSNANVIQNTKSVFTKQEADTLFNALQIGGDTFTDKFINLIRGASSYQLSTSGVLGLTVEDWEAYTQPISDETIEEIIEE